MYARCTLNSALETRERKSLGKEGAGLTFADFRARTAAR
jgi:hypothetical protein